MRLPFMKPKDREPLRIPLPDLATCRYIVYFRLREGARPSAGELRTIIVEWLARYTEEPLRGLLQAYLEAGLLQIEVAARGTSHEPTQAMIRAFRPGELEERRYDEASHVVHIVGDDLLKHPRAGFWCALAAARGLAGELSGVAYSVSQSRLLPVWSYEQSLPTDAWVRLWDHIMMPYSLQSNGKLWMTTTGMNAFGLPNLQVKDVPPNLDSGLGKLVCGIAQHLALCVMRLNLDTEEPARELVIGPDVNITERDIALAQGDGFDETDSPAGHSSVISLQLESRSGFLTVTAPKGHSDHGEWLNSVLANLLGTEGDLAFIEKGDEFLEIAHRKAVSELPGVKARFRQGLPVGTTLFVKRDFPDTDGSSHFIWLVVNTWAGNKITGQIANDPGPENDLKLGQTVALPESEVYDWVISFSDGNHEGNYTGKVLEERRLSTGDS